MCQNVIPVGIGVDILELGRIRRIRHLARFAEYFLTPEEIDIFKKAPDPVSFIASRFAAKEAVIKAFPGVLKPHDFTIGKEGVKPVVRFLAPAARRRYVAAVSLSHTEDYAAGFATVMDR